MTSNPFKRIAVESLSLYGSTRKLWINIFIHKIYNYCFDHLWHWYVNDIFVFFFFHNLVFVVLLSIAVCWCSLSKSQSMEKMKWRKFWVLINNLFPLATFIFFIFYVFFSSFSRVLFENLYRTTFDDGFYEWHWIHYSLSQKIFVNIFGQIIQRKI